MRLFAMTLVEDRGKFFDFVENGIHIRNMKDCENRKMTDKQLSDELDKLFPRFRTLYENTSGLIHFSKEHINQNHQTTVNDNRISGEILFNGEHFFSIEEKIDYSYNMFLVSTELYKLIQVYKLHINEFLKDY